MELKVWKHFSEIYPVELKKTIAAAQVDSIPVPVIEQSTIQILIHQQRIRWSEHRTIKTMNHRIKTVESQLRNLRSTHDSLNKKYVITHTHTHTHLYIHTYIRICSFKHSFTIYPVTLIHTLIMY